VVTTDSSKDGGANLDVAPSRQHRASLQRCGLCADGGLS
jgi:hypothetical protein